MKRTAQIVTALASLLYVSASALAQEDAINAPAQKTIGAQSSKMVPSLAVLNSGRRQTFRRQADDERRFRRTQSCSPTVR